MSQLVTRLACTRFDPQCHTELAHACDLSTQGRGRGVRISRSFLGKFTANQNYPRTLPQRKLKKKERSKHSSISLDKEQ